MSAIADERWLDEREGRAEWREHHEPITGIQQPDLRFLPACALASSLVMEN